MKKDETEAPPTEEEIAAAAALADALDSVESGRPSTVSDSDLADLITVTERARASAGLAAPLSPSVVDSALDHAFENKRDTSRRRRRSVIRWGSVALAASILFIVAGWLLLMLPNRTSIEGPTSVEALAAPTDSLFSEPFEEGQTPSQRVDRIVSARTRGYFAAMIEQRQRAAAPSESTAALAFRLSVTDDGE